LNIYQTYEQGKLTGLEQQLNQTKQQVAAAQQSAQDAKNQVIAATTQANQDRAASAAMITALSAQNANLANQIVQRGKQTQQQQSTDMNSTIPQLTQRFQSLVPGINPADIKVAENGATATIGQDTAQKTVAQLELVPSLQADKTDLEQQVKNGQDMLTSSQKALDSQVNLTETQNKLITAQGQLVTLQQTQLTQSDAACTVKLNIEKANTKKAWFKGFKWGFIGGFVSGIFAGHSF
jgi:hypothetical protein